MSPIPASSVRLDYYTDKFRNCIVSDQALEEAHAIVARMGANQAVYQAIADHFEILWQVVAGLHQMECGLDISLHLANGDPLTADTVHVPVGLMEPDSPPYDFVTAGVAALDHYKRGWGSLSIPDVPHGLLFFDQWNGLGEWKLTDAPGLPYLFAGTDAYVKGKFSSDGVWDPDAVSQQVGIAAILRAMGIRI